MIWAIDFTHQHMKIHTVNQLVLYQSNFSINSYRGTSKIYYRNFIYHATFYRTKAALIKSQDKCTYIELKILSRIDKVSVSFHCSLAATEDRSFSFTLQSIINRCLHYDPLNIFRWCCWVEFLLIISIIISSVRSVAGGCMAERKASSPRKLQAFPIHNDDMPRQRWWWISVHEEEMHSFRFPFNRWSARHNWKRISLPFSFSFSCCCCCCCFTSIYTATCPCREEKSYLTTYLPP